MKSTTYKKASAVVVVLLILLAAALLYKNNLETSPKAVSPEEAVSEDTKVIDTPLVKKLPIVSPQGKPVVITFNRCDSANASLCFGSGAKSLGKINNAMMWEMISTSNKLYFGVSPEGSNAWPHIVEIDFKGNVYDASEYDYYKNKSPELLMQNITNTQ